MGNASGKVDDGERSSEVRGYGEVEGMDEFSPHILGGYELEADPFVHFPPQVPVVPFPRPGEVMPIQNFTYPHGTTEFRDIYGEKLTAVMITWSYGGKHVAVTGSWDNWSMSEPLQRSGEDFAIVKMLPSGVYRYRFIVDEHVRYAPDLPWECNDSVMSCNVLDVKDHVAEAPERLSEFESPPSPEESYNNEYLNNNDFSKPPPDIPPQIQLTLLNERHPAAMEDHQSLPRPRHTVLNHLYIQNDRNQPVALGSTHRFLHKYVTVMLYKPSRR